MRFIHLADLHLDTAFRSRSREIREELRHASRRALESAVDRAVKEEVDALLIAGDLFDGETLTLQTERFLGDALSRLGQAGIQTIYATGNHDPGSSSLPGGEISWPEGVSVLREPRPERIEILRDGRPVGAVTGAGHATHREHRDLSRSFPTPTPGLPEVGLLHTQVGGARGADAHHLYAPSELSHLERSGYDYWALGHVHVRQALSDDPPIHYPGNTQGRTPRETGPKGGLLVELPPAGSPRIRFLELGSIRWERLMLDGLAEEERIEGLSRRIEAAWREARADDPGTGRTRWILRVELAGASLLHRELDREETREELCNVLAASLGLLAVDLRTERLRPAQNVADHLNRTDVLGEALRLAHRLAGPEGPSPSEALELDESELAGFDLGGGRSVDEYLRGLLEGTDADLLDLLLDREAP